MADNDATISNITTADAIATSNSAAAESTWSPTTNTSLATTNDNDDDAAARAAAADDDPYYYRDDEFRNDPAFKQQIVVVKIVGLLSAMGSAYIIYSLLFDVKDAADRRRKLHRTFDRLLLCLSVSDFISSVSYFFGSW